MQREDEGVIILPAYYTTLLAVCLCFGIFLNKLVFNSEFALLVFDEDGVVFFNYQKLTFSLSSDHVALSDIIVQFGELQDQWLLLIVGEYVLDGDFEQHLLVANFAGLPHEVQVLVAEMKSLHFGKLEIVVLEFDYIHNILVLGSVPYDFLLDYWHLAMHEWLGFVPMHCLLGHTQEYLSAGCYDHIKASFIADCLYLFPEAQLEEVEGEHEWIFEHAVLVD